MAKHRILIVDDEADIRFGIGKFLRSRGYEIVEAWNCESAEAAFAAQRPDVVILDYQLPDGSALDVLPRLRAIDSTTPLIVLTAFGTIAMAVKSIKEGAEQFLTKPIELPALEIIIGRALEHQRNRRQAVAGRKREARALVDPFVGTSRVIRRLADDAERVTATDRPILIQGETGSGKTILARWLHAHGPRADEAFVDLNCAGLSREFLETELFGHEKGAFTGAVASKVGMLEMAHRGTVFLDEVGDMDLTVQGALLKVIEDHRFHRLGGVRDVHVDIRLITATHQSLAELVREKRFRGDLYFRVNTVALTVPPLRERAEDIPMLSERLIAEFAGELGRSIPELTTEASAMLKSQPWPGNIRELRSVVERAILLGNGRAIVPDDLRFDVEPTPSLTPASLMDNERMFLLEALRSEGGNVLKTAQRLGLARSALYKKIKKFGIEIPR